MAAINCINQLPYSELAYQIITNYLRYHYYHYHWYNYHHHQYHHQYHHNHHHQYYYTICVLRFVVNNTGIFPDFSSGCNNWGPVALGTRNWVGQQGFQCQVARRATWTFLRCCSWFSRDIWLQQFLFRGGQQKFNGQVDHRETWFVGKPCSALIHPVPIKQPWRISEHGHMGFLQLTI